MSGKRGKYTPEFREQAARLVIETGRPGILLLCSMMMSVPSWNGCASGTLNCVWTVSF